MSATILYLASLTYTLQPLISAPPRALAPRASTVMDSPKTFELADAGAAPAAAFVPLLVNPIVTFTTTAGVIQCELYLDECPITVSNFVDLAESGFYNGLHFHRVIASFMCQFGCPYASDPADARAGSGGPDFGSSFTNLVDGSTISRTGGNIPDEFTAKIRNDAGTLSMANTGAPNSGGSQMFMNVNDNNQLNWYTPGESKHPVFGKCVDAESFNVMVAISELPTQNDRPAAPVKVTSVQIGLPSAAAATGPATATVAEPTQPSPAAEATQPIPAAEATQPSPSIPAGISWADKESKDW